MKRIFSIKQKNLEYKDKANTSANLLKYELQLMYKVCDEIFL